MNGWRCPSCGSTTPGRHYVPSSCGTTTNQSEPRCSCAACLDRERLYNGPELVAGSNGVPNSVRHVTAVEETRKDALRRALVMLHDATKAIGELQAANEVLRKRLILWEGGK